MTKDIINVIQIDEELDAEYEAAKVLRKYPKETVMLNNIKGYDIPVVSGICNTREKIAQSLGCQVDEILYKIIDGMNNPTPVSKFIDLVDEYDSKRVDLGKIPILTHYKRDGGAYITAGVVFARDPETGIQNASIHRMLVLDKNKLAIRIVPRNLYTYFQKAKDMGKDLDISIAIGMEPAILLACTTSIPIDADEMEVANRFKNGELELVTCKNGIVREEPVIKLSKMYIKKENPMYHAILPAGFEHKLLQGMPQEPRIFNAVKNTVPTVQNVVLTEGGCCWLHAAVSIKKQTEGDGKNIIMAALAAHPSLKHVVVVDEDVDIFDPQDIEYAIATRVKGDDDIIIVPKARGSSLDPKASEIDGTTTKVGVDATKSILEPEKFERVSFSE